MTRIVTDKNGSYDLAMVISITKIPQATAVPGGGSRDLPPTAKLHFQSGHAVSTLLPYEQINEAWMAVKNAESHPVDTSDGESARAS